MKFWQFAMLMAAAYAAPSMAPGIRDWLGLFWGVVAVIASFVDWRK